MRANMEFFEATKQQKQLAPSGRKMMDYSEQFGQIHGLGHLKDNGMRILNDLSHIGGKLTRFGAPYGTNQKSFNEYEREIMAKFTAGQLTNEYLVGLK